MAVQKLTSTDAFVVVDFPDAPASGVVRRARKILHSSASDLARSASYTFGALGIERSGASAGINAEGEAVAGAVEAFVAELEPRAASGDLLLLPGKGVERSQLAPLLSASPTAPVAGSEAVLVAGIVAAAEWVSGGSLDGRTVAIEGAAMAPAGLRSALGEAGATVVDVWGVDEKPWLVWGATVDVILTGSKPGVLSHQGAELITAGAIVPWGPIPVTTKAFAQLHRAGKVVVVPDFLATAGGLLSSLLEGDEASVSGAVRQRISAALEESAASDDGLFLGACHRAESFFQEWRGSKPFGRPLAA